MLNKSVEKQKCQKAKQKPLKSKSVEAKALKNKSVEKQKQSEASFYDVNECMSRCKQARIGKKQEVVGDGKETHIQV